MLRGQLLLKTTGTENENPKLKNNCMCNTSSILYVINHILMKHQDR